MRVGLGLIFLSAALAISGSAIAQDDFDDFDDFDEEPAAAPSSNDDFDDFDDDDDGFGDEADGAPSDPGDDFGDDEGDGFGDEDAEDGPSTSDDRWHRRFRAHNTLQGPTGGIRIVDANPAAPGSFRVQLATEFFFASDFLNEGDTNDRIGAHLSISAAVHDYVELSAAFTSSANFNDQEDPALFQALGDTVLGIKVGAQLAPVVSLSGDLRMALLNKSGDIGVVLGSTSLGIRTALTIDLRGLPEPVPFIARFNLGYYFDNSAKLVEETEQRRYDALMDPRAPADEHRHFITRVERFALGINRVDTVNLGIGLEVPLRASEDFYISPILEWTWHLQSNRQGYNCLRIPDLPSEDSCGKDESLAASPMSLTLGVRVLPPIEGFAAFVAVDIGVLGTSTFVRELTPTAPYNVMLGVSYAYDTRPPPPPPEPEIREVERRVEVQIPPPPKGRVTGFVVEQGAGTPVAGARIGFPGRDLSALMAGDGGGFATYQLDPGEVQLEITHPEYNPGGCAATIGEEGGDVEIRCELVALPRVGQASGRVIGDGDAAVSAELVITGPASRTVRSDAAGSFSVNELPPGTYTARVDADGHLIKLQQFEVRIRENTNVQITLVPRPRRPLVSIRRRTIHIRRQINFATSSSDILPSSYALMAEIADVMIRNPDLRLVEVQGHTDNRGGRSRNQELSQRRAESVRRWLTDHGVEGSRMEARGFGMSRPLVPNITPSNRARNRRVQFLIKERSESAAE